MTVALNSLDTRVSSDTDDAAVRARPSTAVAYVDRDHALIVKTTADGAVGVIDIPRRWPEDVSYLLRIVDQVGDRERVVILGPDTLRLELEREYVAVYHRPDRMVDVERTAHETAGHLISRLAELSS
jgi:hypothetical protein